MSGTSSAAARGESWAIVCGVLLCFGAASAVAQTDADRKCQDTIAVAARNYFKAHYSAVGKCENKRADGSVLPAVECRPRECVGGINDGFGCATDLDCPGGSCDPNPGLDAKTDGKLTSAAGKLEKKITKKCTDPLSSGVVLGVPCGTTAPLAIAAVVDCIINQAHGVNAERLLTTVYDQSDAITDEGVRTCQ